MVYLMGWPYLVLVPQVRGYGSGISLALAILVLVPQARGYGNGISLSLAIVSFGSAGPWLRQWYISCIGHM